MDTVILSITVSRELLESGVYAMQGASGHGKEETAATPTNTKPGYLWVAKPFKKAVLRGLFASYFSPEYICIQIFTREEINA